MRKSVIRNLFKYFNVNFLHTGKIHAVFGKGLVGSADHDRQNGHLLLVRQLESSRFEGLDFAVMRPGAFRKHENGASLVQVHGALAEHLFDALLVAAFQLNIAVQHHIPADQRHTEYFNFGHPFVMKEKPEGDQNIQLRLVIGNDHVRRVFPDVVTAFDANPPGRHRPGIYRSPKAGKQMQKPQPPVKGVSNHTNEQSRQKQRNRRQGDKNQKNNADNAIKHIKTLLLSIISLSGWRGV